VPIEIELNPMLTEVKCEATLREGSSKAIIN